MRSNRLEYYNSSLVPDLLEIGWWALLTQSYVISEGNWIQIGTDSVMNATGREVRFKHLDPTFCVRNLRIHKGPSVANRTQSKLLKFVKLHGLRPFTLAHRFCRISVRNSCDLSIHRSFIDMIIFSVMCVSILFLFVVMGLC